MVKLLKFIKYEINHILDNIFKSYLGYHDLEGLCNSPDYFERLQ